MLIRKVLKNRRIIKTDFLKIKTENLFICIFILGIVLGTFLICLSSAKFDIRVNVLGKYFVEKLSGENTDNIKSSSFFFYCLSKYCISAGLFFFINQTKIYKICIYGTLFFLGFSISVMISVLTLTYGKGGLLIYLISIIPHYFAYIPLLIFMIMFSLKVRLERENGKKIMRDTQIRQALMLIFVLLLVLSFLESYVNLSIVRKLLIFVE